MIPVFMVLIGSGRISSGLGIVVFGKLSLLFFRAWKHMFLELNCLYKEDDGQVLQ